MIMIYDRMICRFTKDLHYYSILYAIEFKFTDKLDFTTDLDEIKKNMSEELFDKLNSLKDSLKLDLIILHFERQCFDINEALKIFFFVSLSSQKNIDI